MEINFLIILIFHNIALIQVYFHNDLFFPKKIVFNYESESREIPFSTKNNLLCFYFIFKDSICVWSLVITKYHQIAWHF